MSRTPVIAAAAIVIVSGLTLPAAIQRVSENAPADISPTLYADVQAILV